MNRDELEDGGQYDGSPMLNDAMLVLVGCRELASGASATAHLVPLCPEYWTLSPGGAFTPRLARARTQRPS